MKKIYLFLLCGLLCTVNLNAQTWEIGATANPGGASAVIATLHNDTLTISGTGNMRGLSSAPWGNVRSAITTVIIDDGVTNIGNSAFRNFTSLTSVSIGNSVTTIESHAFQGCTSLTSVIIPNSVTTIGSSAFQGCTSLTSVIIPNSVTSIGSSAFSGCISLTSVSIGNSVTTIGGSAFSGCTALTSVIIPNSVTSIGNLAFFNCTGLTSVTIGNSVTSIGGRAFENCTSLTSVTIPSSVTTIGAFVFSGCTSLTSIEVDVNNPFFSSMDGVLFNKDKTVLIQYPVGKQGAYTIPNSVVSIGNFAFSGSIGLTSVIIPSSVTTIGHYAFENCTGLTSATISSGVTAIGQGAFSRCTGLTSVAIPSSVTSIGDFAFRGCTGLASVTVEWVTPLNIHSNVFNEVQTSNVRLNVPTGRENVYRNANVWGSFIIEQGDYFPVWEIGRPTNADVSAVLHNDTLSISGTGAMMNWNNSSSVPWNSLRTSITTVIIGSGVTTIGNNAFSGCTALTSVIIPGSVTSIGNSAFNGCSTLASIIIPSSVTSIGEEAFANCYGLRKVVNLNLEPQVTASNFFQNIDLALSRLYVVGDEALNLYKNANIWKDFGEITDMMSIGTLQDSISVLQNNISNCENAKNILQNENKVLLDSIGTLNQLIAEWIDITSELLDSIAWLHHLLENCEEETNTPIISENRIQVFPNPVTHGLHIINHDWQPNDVVGLYDMSGRLVFSQSVGAKNLSPLHSGEFIIDMSPFNSGNYILRIGNRVAKIVKK